MRTNNYKIYIANFFLCLLLSLVQLANSASADSWFIDNAASGSNIGTSWANAWQSFSDVKWGSGGVKAGDTLFISGGSTSKTYNGVLRIQESGNSSNSIYISVGQDQGHNGVVIIDRNGSGEAINIQGKSYIIINGEFAGNRHLVLYHGSLSNEYSALVSATGANHIKYLYVEFKKACVGIRQNDQFASNISEIAFCKFHDIRGQNPIDLTMRTGQTPSNFGNFLVHHNIIQPIWEKYNGGKLIKGPDGIKATGSVNFYNNQVIGVNGGTDSGVVVGPQHPDMIQAQNAYWKIYNNQFLNIGDSAIDFDAFSTHYIRHIWIYNNVFSVGGSTSIYPQGIRIYDGLNSMSDITDLLIANNTFVDLYDHLPLRLLSSIGSAKISNVFIKNNIFFNSGTSKMTDAPALSGSTQSDWNFEHNLVDAGSDGSSAIQLDGLVYVQSSGVLDTPTFVRYTQKSDNNDYHLAKGSAGIDQGVDLSSYFTTDKDGNTRSGAWDVGAYEYAGNIVAIENPKNLRVISHQP